MPAKITEVQRGIFELFLPLPMRPTIVNVYLIDCGGGKWTLIDTGMNTADSVATLARTRSRKPEPGSKTSRFPARHPSPCRPFRRLCRRSSGRSQARRPTCSDLEARAGEPDADAWRKPPPAQMPDALRVFQRSTASPSIDTRPDGMRPGVVGHQHQYSPSAAARRSLSC